MRWSPVVAGLLMLIAGTVWIVQGAGALHGSFMTGNPAWLWIGIATDAVARAVVAGNDSRALGAFLNPPFTLGASRRDIARLFFGAGSPHPACRCYAVPDQYLFLTVPSPRFVRTSSRAAMSTPGDRYGDGIRGQGKCG